jgi:protein SCO1/2
MKTLPTLLTGGLLLLMTAGCGRAPAPASATAAPDAAGTRSFEARGVVREIAADRRTAVIRHEEIPGYMPKMTMELNVRDPAELAEVSVGDEITFRLHATPDTHWIDGIRRVGRAPAVAAAETPLFVPEETPELKPGDPVPDAEFLDEHGRPVRLSDFRGRAVAFTFFFTRCPLPDYCPRMNAHFRDARQLLLSRPDAPTNWQFLCVSFDAAFDQPAVLARYARAYRGDNPDRWLFAAAAPATLARLAPRLDLMVIREAGGFSHNLRTVVLDPAGRIFRQFDGNAWTPAELAEALVAAARESGAPGDAAEVGQR